MSTPEVETVMLNGKSITADNRCPACNSPFKLPTTLRGVYRCPCCGLECVAQQFVSDLDMEACWIPKNQD